MRGASLVLAALLAGGCGDDALPPPAEWEFALVRHDAVAHPSYAMPREGGVWVADIFGDAILVLDALPPGAPERVAPPGWRLASPHFLAIAADGGLLVTEGWGTAVTAMSRDGEWARFRGSDGGMSAPHGVCVDGDGWIYVADSLNSRLVRFRDLDGSGWQVFADDASRVGYARQLVCTGGSVYVANSFPDRPGINPGQGGSVLRIDDFDSGSSEVELEFPDAAVNGVWPLDSVHRLVSLWRDGAPLVVCRTDDRQCVPVPAPDDELGIAYGIHYDTGARRGIVAYIGSESPSGERIPGGLVRFSLDGSP